MRTLSQKHKLRVLFVWFCITYISVSMLLGFALGMFDKDITGFAALTGSTALGLCGALVGHFATSPKDDNNATTN